MPSSAIRLTSKRFRLQLEKAVFAKVNIPLSPVRQGLDDSALDRQVLGRPVSHAAPHVHHVLVTGLHAQDGGLVRLPAVGTIAVEDDRGRLVLRQLVELEAVLGRVEVRNRLAFLLVGRGLGTGYTTLAEVDDAAGVDEQRSLAVQQLLCLFDTDDLAAVETRGGFRLVRKGRGAQRSQQQRTRQR